VKAAEDFRNVSGFQTACLRHGFCVPLHFGGKAGPWMQATPNPGARRSHPTAV
jgi:hypothetical protein